MISESGFLTNQWWQWFWTTYSMTVIAIPTVVAFILKLIAIYNPNVKSDQVIDVFKTYWPTDKKSSP